MSDLIKTLHKKGDNTVNVYPNIKSENIPDDAITTAKITNNAITTSKITNNAITYSKLASNSVISVKIESGAVTNSKLGAGSVTADKISSEAITTAKLFDRAVTTSKIENGAVTTDKLGNGAVTNAKLGDNAVMNNNIFNYAITEGKIANNTVTPNKLTFTLYNYGGWIETTNYYISFEVITAENYLDIYSMTLQQWLKLIYNFREDHSIHAGAYNRNTNNYEVVEWNVVDNGDDTYSINIKGTDVTSDTNINDFYKINLFTIS